MTKKQEIKKAAKALKQNKYHDFADGEAEAIVESLYDCGFVIIKKKPTQTQIDEIAKIIDPTSFVNAMLEDDLTPTERLIYSSQREKDKEVAKQKARDILKVIV